MTNQIILLVFGICMAIAVAAPHNSGCKDIEGCSETVRNNRHLCRYRSEVRRLCPVSCGVCKNDVSPGSLLCTDVIPICSIFKHFNGCGTHYGRKYCRKTCKYCKSPELTTTTTITTTPKATSSSKPRTTPTTTTTTIVIKPKSSESTTTTTTPTTTSSSTTTATTTSSTTTIAIKPKSPASTTTTTTPTSTSPSSSTTTTTTAPTTTTSSSTTTTTTTTTTTPTTTTTKAITNALITECLNAHNFYRQKHIDTPNLIWDKEIQQSAQNYANKLASSGKFEHSVTKHGENLYKAFNTGLDTPCQSATKAWYDEIKYYNYAKPGFSGATGHFTQVIWKTTKKIGVGIARVGKTVVVVAQYSPPGNYGRQFDNNVLPPKAS